VSIGLIRNIAVVAAATATLAACSSSAGSDHADEAAAPRASTTTSESPGHPTRQGGDPGAGPATGPTRPDGTKSPGSPTGPRTTSGNQPHGTPTAPESGPTTGGPRARCLTDAAGDLSAAGGPPAYTDIVGTCLRASDASVSWTTTLAGAAPGRMADRDSNLAFRLVVQPASGSATYLVAEAGTDGWSVSLTRDGRSQHLAGALNIDGRSLVVTAPASAVDAGRVSWRVESSWTHSTLLGTDYAFDTAPDRGNAVL